MKPTKKKVANKKPVKVSPLGDGWKTRYEEDPSVEVESLSEIAASLYWDLKELAAEVAMLAKAMKKKGL